ncbi:MAG: hypothetical protein ACE5J9_06455, partial [Methanosarcinales archaeon]
ASVLGLETAACNLIPPTEKEKKKQCENYLDDLSKGKAKPEETLADVFVLVGEEKMNLILEEVNETIKKANELARDKMRKQ